MKMRAGTGLVSSLVLGKVCKRCHTAIARMHERYRRNETAAAAGFREVVDPLVLAMGAYTKVIVAAATVATCMHSAHRCPTGTAITTA